MNLGDAPINIRILSHQPTAAYAPGDSVNQSARSYDSKTKSRDERGRNKLIGLAFEIKNDTSRARDHDAPLLNQIDGRCAALGYNAAEQWSCLFEAATVLLTQGIKDGDIRFDKSHDYCQAARYLIEEIRGNNNHQGFVQDRTSYS